MLISRSGSNVHRQRWLTEVAKTLSLYNGGELYLILYQNAKIVEKFISFHKLIKISSIYVWQ